MRSPGRPNAAYVRGANDPALDALYQRRRLPPLLGAEAFRAGVRRRARSPHREHEGYVVAFIAFCPRGLVFPRARPL